MRRFVLFLFALLIMWALIWCLCLKRDKILPVFSESVPTKVSVQEVLPTSIDITHEYIGHVEAIQSVLVRPYISGFIDEVLVSGGSTVHQDEVLFTLQQEQYLAAVEMAEAKVIAATADLEKARLYLDRIQNTASEAISKTEQDNARTNFFVAEVNLAEAKADLKIAQVNYDYTLITAPITGVVGNISVTKGEYVSPSGSALAYILQYNPIRVRFSMPEKDFLNLGSDVAFFKTGILTLRLSNGEIMQAKGSVRFADNLIQSGTSSINLYADFENTKQLLRPQAYVTVLYEEKKEDVFVIDKNDVHLQPDGTYVYLLQDGKVQKQFVKLGEIVDAKIIVVQGLNKGDLLITSPVSTMQIGEKAVIDMGKQNDVF